MYKVKKRGNNVARGENMKGIWENSEVQSLFMEVEECKNKNKTLREAFMAHARKFNRQPNSVRNYYYHEVEQLGKDENRLESLGINLSKHKKNSITYFSQEEERRLMEEISSLVKKGISVRKACFILSNGDVGQMLRFQNKYRNFLLKNKLSSGKIIANENREIKSVEQGNIIAFKKASKTLTEAEVQSLFMGLVRLVKKNVIAEEEEKYKAELTKTNILLRKALTEINGKERELEKLKAEYLKLKSENERFVEIARMTKCKEANKLSCQLDIKA